LGFKVADWKKLVFAWTGVYPNKALLKSAQVLII
jgi:hypothetical protein